MPLDFISAILDTNHVGTNYIIWTKMKTNKRWNINIALCSFKIILFLYIIRTRQMSFSIYSLCTIVVKHLHTLYSICKMLIILPKEESYKRYVFITDLNKIFHINNVYTKNWIKKYRWIYKNDPVQKFTSPWFLILCCYLYDPQLCLFV